MRPAKWISAWLRQASGKPDRTDGPAALHQVSRSLAALSEATERDFLAVGEKLEAIHSHFQAETASFGGLLEEIDQKRAGHLGRAFDEVAQWAREAGGAADCGALLAGLGPVARAVNGPVLELGSSLRVLRVMSIMTRVESARLGDEAASFDALAIRADEMAIGIGRKADDILRTVEELCGLLDRAGRTVGEMSRLEQAELAQLAGQCSAGLEELRREHGRAAEAAASVRSACGNVASGIAGLVMGLQCHDSMRQRLEHVRAAIDELAASPVDGEAVGLQAAQLREAGQTFLAEFGRIAGTLDDLGERASGAARTAREFGGGEEKAGAGDTVAQLFTEAAAQVDGWIASRLAIAEAVGKVDRKCAEMAGFVSEIEAVGAQMLWVALNAEIQAARLSGSGAVMEAVAQGIRRVSQSACAGAAAAGDALRAVEAGAQRLAAALGDQSGGSTQGAGNVAGRIREIVSQLAATGAEHRRLLQSLAESGERIAGEVAALRQSMAADRVMEQTSAECLASLERIAAESHTAHAPRARRDTGWLHRAQKNYAMHAEREVHAAFAAGRPSPRPPGPAAAAPEPVRAAAPEFAAAAAHGPAAACPEEADGEAPPASAAGPSEFGDNVELF